MSSAIINRMDCLFGEASYHLYMLGIALQRVVYVAAASQAASLQRSLSELEFLMALLPSDLCIAQGAKLERITSASVGLIGLAPVLTEYTDLEETQIPGNWVNAWRLKLAAEPFDLATVMRSVS